MVVAGLALVSVVLLVPGCLEGIGSAAKVFG